MVGLTTGAMTQYVKCSSSRALAAEITALGISFCCFFFLFLQILFGLDAKSCPTLATPWAVACQALLSMGLPGRNTGVGCHFLLHWYQF